MQKASVAERKDAALRGFGGGKVWFGFFFSQECWVKLITFTKTKWIGGEGHKNRAGKGRTFFFCSQLKKGVQGF